VPHGLSRVPGRNAFLDKRVGDDAAPVALHVHVENATHELCALFENMDFAVTHFKPARDLARRDNAAFRLLALGLPVLTRAKRLVLALAIRAHHVGQDGEEGSVGCKVQYDVLRCEPDSDAVLRDVQEQHQCLIHPVSCQSVERLRYKHRTWRNLAVLDALEEAAKLSGLRVVAAKSGHADVLHSFGDR